MAYNFVSEEDLKYVADNIGPNSNLHKILEYAEEFKAAGLTPLYYTDDDYDKVYLTTEERMTKLFN